MRAVVRYTLSQKIFLNLVFVGLMVAGAYAMLALPVERYPEINFGKVFISTFWPGANPSEVETLITTEIEEALEDLEGVEFIRSTSYRERSGVVVKFIDDMDYEDLYDELRFRVQTVQKELPEGAEPSVFKMIRTGDWLPVLVVNLHGERGNRALALMAEEIKTPISQIPNVQEVRLEGEYQREFHVYLDPERMARYGVTFDQAAAALQNANISIPAGDFTDQGGEFVVKVDEKFRTRPQVVDTIVRRDGDGSFVRIADLISRPAPNQPGGAEMGYRDPLIISSVNGQDSVALYIVKNRTGNALDIAAQVREIIASYKDRLAEEGVSATMTQDSTVYIDEAMSTLGSNLLAGIFLVSLILLYFLGFRNACLTTLGIPFSFLTTMVLMWMTGNSLNEITLFTFVLVSGIIVDDAIVVIENIYRVYQTGRPLRESVIEGTAEVFLPVVSATTTTMVAFLPMLIMTGSTGEFFALIPKAVTFALAASLIECLFMLPIHYFDYGPKTPKTASPHKEGDNAAMRVLLRATQKLNAITLRYRFLTITVVVLAFVASMAVLGLSISGKVPLVRIKFFPDEYSIYFVTLEAPSSTPIEDVSAKLKEISEFIMADGPGMAESVTGTAGMYVNEDYENIFGKNVGMVTVTLPERAKREFGDSLGNDPIAHLERMREKIQEKFNTSGNVIKVRAEKGGPPTGKAVNVRVVGPNPTSVQKLADAVMAYLQTQESLAPYLTDLDTDQGRLNRVFRFRVRDERAAEYGLTPSAVAGLAAGVLDGRYIGKFRLPDEEVDLKLRIDPRYLSSPDAALSIPLVEHPSGPVRLGDLTRVETYTQPEQRNRYNFDRAVTISANLVPGAPTSTPAVINEVKQFYSAIANNYPGASVIFAGEFENTQRSYASLTYAFAIAVMLIYVILAAQFQSYSQPLIILSAIVFSLIGVVTGKLITQSLFTVNSFIAVVGVTGVVVNDSLVLITFINQAYSEGKSRREAIEYGVRTRLRPILLTTLTTSLGLLPLAVGFPYYSLVWGTMASTFVTGLCTATALTLFVVPVLWDLLEGARLKLQKRKIAAPQMDKEAAAQVD